MPSVIPHMMTHFNLRVKILLNLTMWKMERPMVSHKFVRDIVCIFKHTFLLWSFFKVYYCICTIRLLESK